MDSLSGLDRKTLRVHTRRELEMMICQMADQLAGVCIDLRCKQDDVGDINTTLEGAAGLLFDLFGIDAESRYEQWAAENGDTHIGQWMQVQSETELDTEQAILERMILENSVAQQVQRQTEVHGE